MARNRASCGHQHSHVLGKVHDYQLARSSNAATAFRFPWRLPDYSELVDSRWEKTIKAEADRRSSFLIYRFDVLRRWRMKLGHWLVNRRINKEHRMREPSPEHLRQMLDYDRAIVEAMQEGPWG